MKQAAQKIRWVPQDERDENGDCDAVGERNGNIYQIFRGGDGMVTATHFDIRRLVVTTLAKGVTGKVAWRACVDHHNVHYIAA
jgi:hypothetical protein